MKIHRDAQILALNFMAPLIIGALFFLRAWVWIPFPLMWVAFTHTWWALLILPVFYALTASGPALRLGGGPIPTLIYAGFLGVLNVIWLQSVWKDGVEFNGTVFTCIVAAGSILAWGALLAVAIGNLKRKSERSDHWVRGALFCWTIWMAFPYIGEMP